VALPCAEATCAAKNRTAAEDHSRHTTQTVMFLLEPNGVREQFAQQAQFREGGVMDDRTKQRLQALLDEHGAYLGKLFGTTSFASWENSEFVRIEEPVTLGGVRYNLRLYRKLTGHPVKSSELLLKYAFYLATPSDGTIKERFLAESKKLAEGKPHDKNVIGQYYMPFAPGFREAEDLKSDLANLLSREAFAGKGYKFASHLVCLTADSEFALIFFEVGSVMRILEATKL
jgi:hypothetical protein